MRQVRIDGTRGSVVGELAGLEQWFEVTDHRTGKRKRTRLAMTFDGHGGGEGPLVDNFLAAVRGEQPLSTSAGDARESHRIAFAAMVSASEGRLVSL
jgi:predicted dehydrogenase